MGMRIWSVAAVAAVALSSCSGSTPTTAPSAGPSPAPTTAAPTPTPTYSSGDVAACRGYARSEPAANSDLATIAGAGLPVVVTAAAFKRHGDTIRDATVTTADPALAAALKGVVAGFRSAEATTRAYTTGTLDLRADLQVIYDQSTKVVQICRYADPATTVKPLKP